MAPLIISARPEDLDRGPGAALAGLGKNVSEFASKLSEVGRRAGDQKRRDELAERRLDLEERRVENAELKEQNLAAARTEKEEQREAGREAALRDLATAAKANKRVAFASAMGEAMRSPGGVLGPYGMLNPRAIAKGAEGMAGVEERVAAKVEVAKRMTPEAGRGYLEKARKEERDLLTASSFKETLENLQDAAADGVLDEGRVKQYGEALQTLLAEGGTSEPVRARLAKEYQMHAKLQLRAQDWGEADKKAAALIDGLRKLASEVPPGIDPVTGKDAQAEMVQRLADGKAEWARTQYPSFRMKSDAAESLAGLQKILFEAGAEADPEEFLRAHIAEQGLPPTREHQRRVAAAGSPGSVPRGTEDRDILGRSAGGGVRKPAVETETQRELRARGKTSERKAEPRPMTGERDVSLLKNYVADNAMRSLRAAGDDRVKATARVIAGIRKDLGIDPHTPEAKAIIREVLVRAFEAGGS